MPEKINAEDSIAFVSNFTQEWIRKTIIEEDALRSTTNSDKIERLVENYRSDLIIEEFERKALKSFQDTAVSVSEIETYYDNYKEEIGLNEFIVRCKFAKIKASARGLDNFYELWKRNKVDRIQKFCEENADFYFLNDKEWHTVDYVLSLCPSKMFKSKSFKTGAILQDNGNGFEYFIRVLEFRNQNDIPPLEYVYDDIKKIILHRRKNTFLALHKEELYDKVLKQQKIKNYLKI